MNLARARSEIMTWCGRMVEHDPESWIPVFGKDHAPRFGSDFGNQARGEPPYRKQVVGPVMDKIAASFAAQDRHAQLGVILLAVTAFIASAVAAPGSLGVLGGVLGLLMLAVILTDARFFIIPDVLSTTAFAVGLLQAVLQNPDLPLESIVLAVLRGAFLVLMFGGLRLAYRRWRGREGIGLGDVKLAGVAGVWLDWPIMPIAIEIAALSALAVYGFRQLVLRRPILAAAKVPFGVFLGPAIWVGWLIEATL
jgi:leader peptidase (prepilin peptidase)/N-methyltransferase